MNVKALFFAISSLVLIITMSVQAQNGYSFPEKVKPLIDTRWGQWHPFNALSPAVEREGEKVRPAAGCGAVAMAQIINYHRFPSYSPDREYEYDWSLMYHQASNSLRLQQVVAVAKLISDCGVSAFTDYGAQLSSTRLQYIMSGLKRLYGYSDYMGIYSRDAFQTPARDSVYRQMLFEELYAGRPVIYRGETEDGKDSHLFIIDGCKDERVHINLGWAGSHDGYYDLDDLYGYTKHQWMLIGIADSSFLPSVKTIHLQKAGDLANQLTLGEQESTKHIAVSGPVNADDIAVLSRMSSKAVLSSVDMSGALIETIPDSAFTRCSLLTYIVLPDSCIRIGCSAFRGCHNLNRIVFPKGLRYIRSNAFAWCESLISPQLPASLETIDRNAFYGCNGVFHFNIPPHVWKIESNAFAHCRNLISVSLPVSLRRTGAELVKDCPRLKRYNIDPDNPVFYIDGTIIKIKQSQKKNQL